MTWRLCANTACAAEVGELPASEFSLVPHRGICDACIRESGIDKVSTRCVGCGRTVKASVHGVGDPHCIRCAPQNTRRYATQVAPQGDRG